jgi:lipopolysaccharide transport system ATP-binding protein
MKRLPIVVEKLSKRFRITQPPPPTTTRGEAVMAALRAPFQYMSEMMRPPTEAETLWALRDVSFDVQQGEVVGIIGRNGAGKSSLLKILSRITDPTSGRATLVGRVGSLLEVGTGFNHELTGRENIYLSGTILGMRRAEIDRRFDEIVDFAGVEKFIDTPVKRYSSGMNVRLGFAVAAHLEPEILIIDEVLSVGDAAFQRKSLGKMENIAGEGRTILFVSHSMPSIQAFCQRVILLENGQIARIGTPDEVIGKYFDREETLPLGGIDLLGHANRLTPPQEAIFTSLRLLSASGRHQTIFQMGEQIILEVTLDLGERVLRDPVVVFAIERRGLEVCNLSTRYMLRDSITLTGRMEIRCSFDLGDLAPGLYTVADLLLKEHSGGNRLDAVEEITSFEIAPRDIYGTGKLPLESKLLVPQGHWTFTNLPETDGPAPAAIQVEHA